MLEYCLACLGENSDVATTREYSYVGGRECKTEKNASAQDNKLTSIVYIMCEIGTLNALLKYFRL